MLRKAAGAAPDVEQAADVTELGQRRVGQLLPGLARGP